MQKVARGAGLSGLATLILACAMAAPAVAEIKINVAPIHVDVKPTVGHPTTPSFKTVVPQNSKSNLGRPPSVKANVLTSKGNVIITKQTDPATPPLWVCTYCRLGYGDPSLRFTSASLAGAHRNQLDDDPPTAPPEPDPTAGVPSIVVWVLGPAMAAGSAAAVHTINSYPGGLIGIITDISHGFP